MLRQPCHSRTFEVRSVNLESLQGDLLVAVDFKEGVDARDPKEVRHSLVELGKLHLASPLPDDAITSNQFAHAVAVDVINSR